MTISIVTSNHFKYQLGKKLVDLSLDSIIAILIDTTTFVFDPATHGTLADVSDQLPTGNGYTQNNKALANQLFAVDHVGGRAAMTCDDISWTASGGDIGPFGAVILYDDTTLDDTIIGCATLATPVTISDGLTHYIRDIAVEIA